MAVKYCLPVTMRGSSLKNVMKSTEIIHDRSPYAVLPLHDLLICT